MIQSLRHLVNNVPCILVKIDADQGYEFLVLPKDGVQPPVDSIAISL
jgi:hypothetical protein